MSCLYFLSGLLSILTISKILLMVESICYQLIANRLLVLRVGVVLSGGGGGVVVDVYLNAHLYMCICTYVYTYIHTYIYNV